MEVAPTSQLDSLTNRQRDLLLAFASRGLGPRSAGRPLLFLVRDFEAERSLPDSRFGSSLHQLERKGLVDCQRERWLGRPRRCWRLSESGQRLTRLLAVLEVTA